MPRDQKEYGILMYDVPVANMSLYNRIWKAIRARALHLNHSVYLIKWGEKLRIEQIIDEAVQETGQSLVAKFLKFDPQENENIEAAAREALHRDISEILERLEKKINKVGEEAKTVGDTYFKKCNKLLRQVQTLSVMFGFEEDIDGILDQARTVVETQWNGDKRRRESRA